MFPEFHDILKKVADTHMTFDYTKKLLAQSKEAAEAADKVAADRVTAQDKKAKKRPKPSSAKSKKQRKVEDQVQRITEEAKKRQISDAAEAAVQHRGLAEMLGVAQRSSVDRGLGSLPSAHSNATSPTMTLGPTAASVRSQDLDVPTTFGHGHGSGTPMTAHMHGGTAPFAGVAAQMSDPQFQSVENLMQREYSASRGSLYDGQSDSCVVPALSWLRAWLWGCG